MRAEIAVSELAGWAAAKPADDAGDLALLRRYAASGDRDAAGELLTRHADAAYRLARRWCSTPADAEDAVQAAFLQILGCARSYRGEGSVRAWILGFVVGESRNMMRGDARRAARERRAAEERGGSQAPGDALAGRQASVRTAVERLPENYRIPLWLHYYEGLATAEVAAVLQLPEGTVRKRQLPDPSRSTGLRP